VDPDEARRERIMQQVATADVQVTTVGDGPSALQMLRERRIDCMILSPDMTDLTPEDLAQEIQGLTPTSPIPVIVNRDGDFLEDGRWKKLGEVCSVRRVHSGERLLDQAAFFLHCNVSKLPQDKRQLLSELHQSNKALAGKKVLIVDDDMRNIFALSTVLEEHDMNIVSAGNGRDAIRLLQQDREVDIVLMDIMMPEMDGFETMREIRKIPALKSLPIIAVTAKAMKGDRDRCIDAGAWDYLAKPVDTEQMLAVLRAWLHR
jgi:CheY-like chemotaxis protein